MPQDAMLWRRDHTHPEASYRLSRDRQRNAASIGLYDESNIQALFCDKL